MVNVAVIGCGVVGSRHAQALGLLDRGAGIHLVDPSPEARARTSGFIANEMAGRQDLGIQGHADLTGLPPELDVVVVATAATERRALIEQLLHSTRPRYLVLEKFLFQAVEDYAVVAELLRGHGIPAWVNCPRRVWPGYVKLQRELADAGGPVNLEVATYSRFGIGTSAIHLLDALAFLANDDQFDLDAHLVDARPINHRSGGIDFTGTFFGVGSKGSFFRYSANATGNLPPLVQIETPDLRATIDEAGQSMRISRSADDWAWRDEPFQMLPQSRMTHSIVQDLVDHGSCGLAGFESSSRLHLAVLEPLLAHYRATVDKKATLCPIT